MEEIDFLRMLFTLTMLLIKVRFNPRVLMSILWCGSQRHLYAPQNIAAIRLKFPQLTKRVLSSYNSATVESRAK